MRSLKSSAQRQHFNAFPSQTCPLLTPPEAVGDAWAASRDRDLGARGHRLERKKIGSKPEASTIFLPSKRLGQAGQDGECGMRGLRCVASFI